jgi:biotin operon repressor
MARPKWAQHSDAGGALHMDFDRNDLAGSFGHIWPVHVEHFTELLIALRRQFDGDLDCMLVLAVIGVRTMPARRLQQRSFADFEAGLAAEEPSPINVQSIAETTGIPRETVRRKVRALEQAGWIERQEGGYLVVSAQARHDLSPATEATFRYLVAVGAACVAAAGRGLR